MSNLRFRGFDQFDQSTPPTMRQKHTGHHYLPDSFEMRVIVSPFLPISRPMILFGISLQAYQREMKGA